MFKITNLKMVFKLSSWPPLFTFWRKIKIAFMSIWCKEQTGVELAIMKTHGPWISNNERKRRVKVVGRARKHAVLKIFKIYLKTKMDDSQMRVRHLAPIVKIIFRSWCLDRVYRKTPKIIDFQAKCRAFTAKRRVYRRRSLFLDDLRIYLPVAKLQAMLRGGLMRKHIKIIKGKQPIRHTAFPRLGHEDVDGCDCWLPDPSRQLLVPKPIQKLFIRTTSFELLMGGNCWLVGRAQNQSAWTLESFEDTWIFSELKDCHLMEGSPDRRSGHHAIDHVMLRLVHGDVIVIKFNENPHTYDLTDFVQDQHLHVQLVKSFIAPQSHPSALNSKVLNNEDLVYLRDELMTRGEKIKLRKERKKLSKEAGAQGVKIKKIQIPLRFRNLTTQEYHEAVRREQEDVAEWIQKQGKKAYPQWVKEWLNSPAGSAKWNQIHNFAVTQPELAVTQLAKINKILHNQGKWLGDLILNQDLVTQMSNKQKKQQSLQAKQLAAKSVVKSASELSREYWADHTSKILEKVTVSRNNMDKTGGWADQAFDDTLPDLAEWNTGS
jgi:hypothetical protein